MTRRRLPLGIQTFRKIREGDKYRDLGEPIHLIGVEFSRETRNIVAFDVERA